MRGWCTTTTIIMLKKTHQQWCSSSWRISSRVKLSPSTSPRGSLRPLPSSCPEKKRSRSPFPRPFYRLSWTSSPSLGALLRPRPWRTLSGSARPSLSQEKSSSVPPPSSPCSTSSASSSTAPQPGWASSPPCPRTTLLGHPREPPPRITLSRGSPRRWQRRGWWLATRCHTRMLSSTATARRSQAGSSRCHCSARMETAFMLCLCATSIPPSGARTMCLSVCSVSSRGALMCATSSLQITLCGYPKTRGIFDCSKNIGLPILEPAEAWNMCSSGLKWSLVVKIRLFGIWPSRWSYSYVVL